MVDEVIYELYPNKQVTRRPIKHIIQRTTDSGFFVEEKKEHQRRIEE